MYQKMRRADRQVTEDECITIIKANNAGTLSLSDTNGYPYGVPLNYMFHSDAIYFHCAKEGKKIDLIAQNAKACFTVIGKNEVVPKDVSTNYQSVIIFGDIEIVADKQLKHDMLIELGAHFGCERGMLEGYVAAHENACHLLRLNIAYMSGKARR